MLLYEQISFVEAIAPRTARYKSVATIQNHKFNQVFCLPPDVPAAVQSACASRADAYISLCDYRQPRRMGDMVFGFTSFGFDVDCHTSADPAADALRAYAHLRDCLFGTDAFPHPSMVEHTGRGLLILIAFHRAPKQVLPLWRRMGECFAERIRAALPAYATLDATYADAARIVRVPGSYNTKAGRNAEWLQYSDDFPVYELSRLRDAYCLELNPASYKAREAAKTPEERPKLIYTDQCIRLHVDRLDDLVTLCELREYKLEGLRETILFLYRYWTCFFIGPKSALEAAQTLNARFPTPLPSKEVLEATRSAEEAFERWKEDKTRGYNYRNSTLIRLLNITPEEERRMKTIVSKAEKARRRAEKGQWGHDQRKSAREKEKERRRAEIAAAVEAGMTHREICEKFQCSTRTIQDILARQTSFPH